MGVRGSGRKPKDVSQHLADGTFRKHRHSRRVDGELGGTLPVRPRTLQAAGRVLWDTVIERLPGSLLDKLDTSKLAKLCRIEDLISKTKETREFIRLCELFDRYGRQFGLSPMDRASLKMQPDTQDEDEAEKYMAEMSGLKVTG